MKYTISILLISLITSAFNDGLAQLKDKNYYTSIMEDAVRFMDAGNYPEADERFKEVLKNLDVLPAEICYYFGKNSYYIEEYKQSINWLNKYIELKGTKGQFFKSCVEYLEKSEQAYLVQQESEKENILYELSRENEFDCGGNQFFKCPICKGEGVVFEPGKINNVLYKTCPYCAGNGRITCDEYKLFLKGELKPKQ